MNRKKVDESRLRGWAKSVQERLEAIEQALPTEPQEPKRQIIRSRLPESHRQEVHERRYRLWQVQNWTYAGMDKRGKHRVASLDTGIVPAGEVWAALRTVEWLHGLGLPEGPLPPFEKWVAGLIAKKA